MAKAFPRGDPGRRRLVLSLRIIGIVLILGLAQPIATHAAEDSSSCVDLALFAQSLHRPDTGRPLLFDEFIRPLVETTAAQRAQRAEQDPRFAHRIDQALNARRINVALLGYGEEHEQTYADVGVSVTIVSLNLDTWDMASISLSRDIRAPELEDQSAREPPRWPVTLRPGYQSLPFAPIPDILEHAPVLTTAFQLSTNAV